MRRREFIAFVGSTAIAWPLAVRAQQPAMPVVGFLRPNRADESGHLFAAVRQGLRESGYPSNKITIEARWADDQAERLPNLVAELVNLQVSAIVGSVDAALAAKKVTTNIPIIFITGGDPEAVGLVSNISRPGGNVTGISFYSVPIIGKRFALLRELVPTAEVIAVLEDPNFSIFSAENREIEAAARTLGQKIITLKAEQRAGNRRRLFDHSEIRRRCSIGWHWPVLFEPPQSIGWACRYPRNSGELCAQRGRRCRRTHELRGKPDGCIPPRWHLCRAYSQG
jgi:putative tryptophan/tyrosine transport system substrate-binding protein